MNPFIDNAPFWRRPSREFCSEVTRHLLRSLDLRPAPWSDPDTQRPSRSSRPSVQSLPLDLLFVIGVVFFLCLGFWSIVQAAAGLPLGGSL